MEKNTENKEKQTTIHYKHTDAHTHTHIHPFSILIYTHSDNCTTVELRFIRLRDRKP